MTPDEIIEMAIQAGVSTRSNWAEQELGAFAKLVAEREREKLRNIAFFDMWYQEMNAAVLAEREACAKVADDFDPEMKMSNYGQVIANKIRARGEA
jgi:hypothetical protein